MEEIHISLCLSKISEPITIDITKETTVISLCFQILNLFGYPPNTEIHLINFESGEKEFNLDDIKYFCDRLNKKFLVSFSPFEISVDQFFEKIKNNENNTEITTAEAFKEAVENEAASMKPYCSYIFLHQILSKIIDDIIKGNETTFANYLCTYFKDFSNNPLFSKEIVISSLTKEINEIFGDTLLWNRYDENTHFPIKQPRFLSVIEFNNLCTFFSDLIINHCDIKYILRSVLDNYKPSEFVINIILKVTQNLILKYEIPKVFRIASKLFGDSWLYKCFPNSDSIYTFCMNDEFINIYPYLLSRHSLLMHLEEKIPFQQLNAVITVIDSNFLKYDSRFTKCFMNSLFPHLYKVINQQVPCLTISQSTYDSMIRSLTGLYGLFSRLMQYQCNQIQFLNSFLKYWKLYSFEPKGLCYFLIGFFIQHKLLNSFVLYKWIKSKEVEPYKDALLIELNTFILSYIQLPQIIEENKTL